MSVRSGKSRGSARSQFLAGAGAGALAELIMHPMDTVNLRMKSERLTPFRYSRMGVWRSLHTIAVEEGVRGLYAGVSTTLLGALPVSGLYFAGYEVSKRAGDKYLHQKAGVPLPAVHLMAGAVAELSCSALQVPMEIIRSRQQLQGHPALGTKLPYWYRNPFHAFSCIYRDEGFFGLYQGYRSSLLLDCSFAALQFAMYEQLKVFGGSVVGRPLHDQENLMTGAVAGALAGMLTNPLDVIVARLQTQGQPRRYAGVVDCCTRILREEGVSGFCKGTRARVLWVAPQSGLAFAAYEVLKTVLGC